MEHLADVGRAGDLHRLLALETTRGRNAWYARKESLGDIAGYAADIAIARDVALAQTRCASTTSSSTAAKPFRYGLIEATLASLASAVDPTLAGLAAADGLWSVPQALAYARAAPDPYQRGECLASIARARPEVDQIELLEEALDAIRRSTRLAVPWYLESFTRQLPEPVLRDLLDGLPYDDTQRTDPSEWHQWSQVRAAAAIRLGELQHLDEAVDLALSLPPGFEGRHPLATALRGVAPHLTEPLLRQALAHGGSYARAGLLPHLARLGYWEEAIVGADQLSEEDLLSLPHRAECLANIARFAPVSERQSILTRALAAARRFAIDKRHIGLRANAFAPLLPVLNGDQRELVLREAVDRLKDDAQSSQAYVETLLYVARDLPDIDRAEFLGQVVALARSPSAWGMSPHMWDTFVTEMLIPIWPGSASSAGFALAREVGAGAKRRAALLTVAARVTPSERRAVLLELIDEARRVGDAGKRALALLRLAPFVPGSRQPLLLAEVRELVTLTEDPADRSATAAALALQLPHADRLALFATALEAAADASTHQLRADLVATLAQALPVELFEKARAILARISPERYRARALIALIVRAPAAEAVDIANDALQALREVGDEKERGELLALLAPGLPDGHLPGAFEIASAISSAGPRAQALGALLSRARGDGRIADALLAAIRESQRPAPRSPPFPALRNAPRVEDFATRRSLNARIAHLQAAQGTPLDQLAGLLTSAAHLAHKRRHAAARILLRDARRAHYVDERVQALCLVSTYLASRGKRRILAEALALAQRAGDPASKAFALAYLSWYQEESGLSETMQRAIEAVALVESEEFRAELLAILAGRVPTQLIERFLAETGRLGGELDRVHAWAGLTSRLDEAQKQSLLSEALALREAPAQAAALTALLPGLPQGAKGAVLEKILDSLHELSDRKDYLNLFEALEPHLLNAAGTLRDRALHETIDRLSGQPRKEWLENVVKTIPLLHAQGDWPATDEFAASLNDVGRWWP